MRSRPTAVVLLLTLVGALLTLSATSASAATFRSGASTTRPIVGEYTRITGAINPAGRSVQLQRYSHGRWARVLSSRAGSHGRYTFRFRAPSAATSYRTYAPATKIKHKRLRAAYSNTVRLSPVRAALSLSLAGAPVGRSSTLLPGSAGFYPARPGTWVTVQKLVSGRWVTAASGRQDASGRFNFSFSSSPADPGTYRAMTRPSSLGYTTSPWAHPVPLTQQWSDEFDGTSLDTTKWVTRFQPPTGLRQCSMPAADRVSVGGGYATLSVAKTSTKLKNCPKGFWHNPMIGSTGTNGFTGAFGTYAARVKFQSAQGMHGSFWLQTVEPGGAEIDTAEYFGDHYSRGGLSNFVHYADSHGRVSTAGGLQNYSSILGGKAPSSGWHVYSVQWTPSSYVFRLDGVPTLTTNRPKVVSTKEEMVLSLLTSDWELPKLTNPKSTMQVDWVRVWQ